MNKPKPLRSHEQTQILHIALNFSAEQRRIKEMLEAVEGWSRLDAILQVATASEEQLKALEFGATKFSDPIRGLFQYELAKLISDKKVMDAAAAEIFARDLEGDEIMLCAECLAEGENPEEALGQYRRSLHFAQA